MTSTPTTKRLEIKEDINDTKVISEKINSLFWLGEFNYRALLYLDKEGLWFVGSISNSNKKNSLYKYICLLEDFPLVTSDSDGIYDLTKRSLNKYFDEYLHQVKFSNTRIDRLQGKIRARVLDEHPYLESESLVSVCTNIDTYEPRKTGHKIEIDIVPPWEV